MPENLQRVEKVIRCEEKTCRACGSETSVIGAVIGVDGMRRLTRTLKRFAGDNLAEWIPDTPHAAGRVPRTSAPERRPFTFLPASRA